MKFTLSFADISGQDAQKDFTEEFTDLSVAWEYAKKAAAINFNVYTFSIHDHKGKYTHHFSAAGHEKKSVREVLRGVVLT